VSPGERDRWTYLSLAVRRGMAVVAIGLVIGIIGSAGLSFSGQVSVCITRIARAS
jgi:hypothetical protein